MRSLDFLIVLFLLAALWPTALWSTQPLTKMSIRNLNRDKGQLADKANNLTAIYVLAVQKMWKPQCLITLFTFTS
jgi:hypothetical protein